VQYRVLATDYDGTLAHDGHVDSPIREALVRFKATGRQLVLVTGREWDELSAIFPKLELFDALVLENGAMLNRPPSKDLRVLCESPNLAFVDALRARKVVPLSVGKAIVATFRPNERVILEVIREMGLELQVIFNKDAVMVLPSGVNKATGLVAALQELNCTPSETVGIGDAENDHAFLSMCGFAAAVDNALPSLKERADLVTQAARGRGVVELIDRILADSLPSPRSRSTKIESAERSLEAKAAS
jgi:HAD superfamily hydrolase (TIGR01484 family)